MTLNCNLCLNISYDFAIKKLISRIVWIKAAVLGGLGITIAFYSSRKRIGYYNRKLGVVAREENDNGFDRLPDDILCNIVSRLTPIEASRISILSRRWRKVRTMNDRLIFSCLYALDISKKFHDHVADGDKERFLKAVDQCLQLYSGLELKIFFMHCCFLNDHTSHLIRWMEILARLDVQELYLGNSCRSCNGFPLNRPFTFSFNLIDGFSRLRYLELASCYVETGFVSHCNSLISLDLTRVPLLSHELSDILLSCPNLRSLCMEGCELPQNLRISGPNLKLESLIVRVCYNVQKLEISDFNVMTLKIHIRNEVEIFLSSVPKLVRLHLRTPSMNYRFGDFPRDLPQLKSLLVQTSYQILRFPPTFQVFRNIRILFLMATGVQYPEEASEEVDLWNFAPVLSACPLLKEFYLEVGGPFCKEERMRQWPVLRHENLWLMELSGFSNTQNELEFAKFVLTSAQVLRSLRLRLSTRRFDGRRFYFEDVKDLKQIDAEAVCADLQGHAISLLATVELF